MCPGRRRTAPERLGRLNDLEERLPKVGAVYTASTA